MPYIEEELKFATNEQRIVAVHEHLAFLVSKAREAVKNGEELKCRELIDTTMDTVATLDMHLDFKSNPPFASMIRRWYGFWTLQLLGARTAKEQEALAILEDLEGSIGEFILSLREGMAQRETRHRDTEQKKGASGGGVSFKA